MSIVPVEDVQATAARAAPAGEGAALAEPPPVSIRCFGGFRMEIAGRPVDITSVRARARSALRLLATHAGQVVHKEILIEALWPGLPVRAATRNLQVTISALRGLLGPAGGRHKAQMIIRSGEAYGIQLPPGAFSDTAAFLAAVTRWKRARLSNERSAEIEALRAVLAAYPDELLPEEGPAEWAVEVRGRFHRLAAQAARALSVAELARGNAADAVAAAEHCLTLDSLDDEAWRTLIRAYTESGAPAKAVEVRGRYAEMLASLGLPETGTDTVPAPRPSPGPNVRSGPAPSAGVAAGRRIIGYGSGRPPAGQRSAASEGRQPDVARSTRQPDAARPRGEPVRTDRRSAMPGSFGKRLFEGRRAS